MFTFRNFDTRDRYWLTDIVFSLRFNHPISTKWLVGHSAAATYWSLFPCNMTAESKHASPRIKSEFINSWDSNMPQNALQKEIVCSMNLLGIGKLLVVTSSERTRQATWMEDWTDLGQCSSIFPNRKCYQGSCQAICFVAGYTQRQRTGWTIGTRPQIDCGLRWRLNNLKCSKAFNK